MRRMLLGAVSTLALGWSVTAMPSAPAQEPAALKIPAPALQGIQEWINSKPMRLKDLKGKVVVVHFWTFG